MTGRPPAGHVPAGRAPLGYAGVSPVLAPRPGAPRGAAARLAAVLLAALALGAVAHSQATVRVGGGKGLRLAEDALSGFNYGNSMRVVGWEDRFAALGLTSLRFPPGNVADEQPLNAAAVAALKVNWELLGQPELTFVANLFTGSPAETAASARLLLEAGIDVTLWEIGNEPDLYAANRLDPSWTPERYCAAFREHGAALRDVVPGARLAGPGVSGARPGGLTYLAEVLRLCGDAIDILTFHVYPTDGTWSDATALATADLVTGELERIGGWLADPEANPLGHERSSGVGVTEFGLSWRTNNFRHLEDMPAALWLADTLGRLAEGGVAISHYFALQAMGGHGLIDSSGWVRPTYHVYALLAGFRGEVLETAVAGAAGLTAYAVTDGGAMSALLVNRSEDAISVGLELPAGAPTEFEVRVLNDATFDLLDGPSVAAYTVGAELEAPAKSIVVLRSEPSRAPNEE